MRQILRSILVATVALFAIAGCGTSRWAMDHPSYAKKYREPYEDDGKFGRMAKQLVDARHTSGDTGAYVSTSASAEPVALGGEVGVFVIPPLSVPWLETRVGLQGLIGTGVGAVGGIDGGVRAQVPGALAAGGEPDTPDDPDLEEDSGFLGAVYPEAGVHFWLNGHNRVTFFSRYYCSTLERDSQFWMFGIGLGGTK